METEVDLATLATLHKNIIRAVRTKARYQFEWDSTCLRAFLLQDILSAENSSTYRFYSTARPIPDFLAKYRDVIALVDFICYVKVAPYFYKFMGILFGAMSLTVVWASVTYGIKINDVSISIIGTLYQAHDVSYSSVEIVSLAFLGYMLLCCVNSIFRIKIFNMFSIHPYHHTSDVSMCWFSSLMCRLGILLFN
jgi:hypothetical protein